MIALPKIHQSVGVYVVEWEIELRSRIEDSAEGSLTIAIPSDGRSERSLPRGAVIYLDWICDRGVVRVRGVVSEFVHIPIPALQIMIVGETEIHQRRNYVRASANLKVGVVRVHDPEVDTDFALLPEQIASGTTFDMSGGGMRVRLSSFNVEVDARLLFEVTMPDDSIVEVVGTITRRPLPDVYCVEFEKIDKHAQERVVRLVFDRLRVNAGRAA